MMERSGGCACGAIRFKISGAPVAIGICHCTNCQRSSGGGPAYVALVPRPALALTQGTPKAYSRPGDSGQNIDRMFCGDCGTPLWNVPDHGPLLTVRLGAFDDAVDLAPQVHIYVASAPAWHPLNDDLPKFPGMPPAAH